MTKIIAYTALHYGSDYLASAIRSVIDSVDEYWVLYTSTGSHGSLADVPCPDSEEKLYAIAAAAAGDKLYWRRGSWSHEGEQRDTIHRVVPDADVILTLDADEVWSPGTPEEILKYVSGGYVRHLRIRMVHYWRSFYRAVTTDPAYPVRVVCPKVQSGDETFIYGRTASGSSPLSEPQNSSWINHFGYAQNSIVTAYKQYTHGHRHEWRSDIDWYRDRFLANAQQDCHPVNVNYWNPVAIQPFLFLPAWMQDHPYAKLDLIK